MHGAVFFSLPFFFKLGLLLLLLYSVNLVTSDPGASIQNQFINDKELNGQQIKKVEEVADRIIIVYPVDGCRGSASESVSDSIIAGLELQSPRRARDIALSELERRINALRSQRITKNEVDLRNLSPDDTKRSSLISSINDDSSMKLSTQYLNAIQMEITNVPLFMTNEEMIEMSESLPCVQMVSKDFIKTVGDPVEAEPISTDSYRHLFNIEEGTRQRNNRKYRRADGDRFLIDDLDDNVHFSIDDLSNYRQLQGAARDHNRAEGIITQGLTIPNDQLFPDQWHSQQSQQWSIRTQSEWTEWRGK